MLILAFFTVFFCFFVIIYLSCKCGYTKGNPFSIFLQEIIIPVFIPIIIFIINFTIVYYLVISKSLSLGTALKIWFLLYIIRLIIRILSKYGYLVKGQTYHYIAMGVIATIFLIEISAITYLLIIYGIWNRDTVICIVILIITPIFWLIFFPFD